ncbi:MULTISPECIES: type 4a pilus biogenesis protein PilO [Actinoplanes]|uniref:type 4a pilus biogenesis protein PilO n=1 Tax=Actinoplanes TaxID=1865 RepID=UPI0005F2E3A2|nr:MULTISPECIES: type 4a pilus biogenesis protein PilO [Actinoplanes]
MGGLRVDRIWLFGGLTLIVVLMVASWFLLINPKYAAADEVQTQTGETSTQLAKMRSSLAELKTQSESLSSYKADLRTYQAALPLSSNTNSLPAFLKQLQSIGVSLQVAVNGYSAADPVVSEEMPSVSQLAITLNASGSVENLSKFLRKLQQVQPRAVLIQSAQAQYNADDTMSIALSLNAFVTSSTTESVD